MCVVDQSITGTKEKENPVLLYLRLMMSRLNVDNLTFFRMAHIRMFGTDPDLHDDVAQYILHGVVPRYVQAYLKILREG